MTYYSTRATRRRARLRAALDLAGGLLMAALAYALILAAWAARGPL